MNGWKRHISQKLPPRIRSNLYDSYWRLFPSRNLIIQQFRHRHGVFPNLSNPQTFNEKIQWLKLHWFDNLAEQCADKYQAREFVRTHIGEEYLIPAYGTYTSISSKEIEHLPNQFVLKGTHGSGWVIICRNKQQMDWPRQINRMQGWLRRNYYWKSREWVYKCLTPRILAEELLVDPVWTVPLDYKVHCFHGIPHFIQVDIDRFGNHSRNFYDFNWNLLEFGLAHPINLEVSLPSPDLALLDTLCRKLSHPFPYVRVDFYWHKQQFKFGELTFFHGSGLEQFTPNHWDQNWGTLISLPIKHD